MGATKRDRVRKTHITGELKKKKEIQNQIERWFGNVKSMDNKKIFGNKDEWKNTHNKTKYTVKRLS